MLNNEDLININECMEFNVNYLNIFLSKYNTYLSQSEKEEIREKIHRYTNTLTKVEIEISLEGVERAIDVLDKIECSYNV